MIQKEKDEQLNLIRQKLKTMTTIKRILATTSNYEQSLMTTGEHTPRNKSTTQTRNTLLQANNPKQKKHQTQLTITMPSLVILQDPLIHSYSTRGKSRRMNYNYSEGHKCRMNTMKNSLATSCSGSKSLLQPLLTQRTVSEVKRTATKAEEQHKGKDFPNDNYYILINQPEKHQKPQQQPFGQSKLLQVNINQTKKDKMSTLLVKGGLKRGSLTDRLVFNALKPHENIEDYYQSTDCRPWDKYAILKRQLMKTRRRMTEMINEIKKTQSMSESIIKVQVSKLKFRRIHHSSPRTPV